MNPARPQLGVSFLFIRCNSKSILGSKSGWAWLFGEDANGMIRITCAMFLCNSTMVLQHAIDHCYTTCIHGVSRWHGFATHAMHGFSTHGIIDKRVAACNLGIRDHFTAIVKLVSSSGFCNTARVWVGFVCGLCNTAKMWVGCVTLMMCSFNSQAL